MKDQRDIVFAQLERAAKELEEAKERLEECEANNKEQNDTIKLKGFTNRLLRLGLYLILFCMFAFAVLSISSYFWLESLKLDMDDVMSFDQFEDTPQK